MMIGSSLIRLPAGLLMPARSVSEFKAAAMRAGVGEFRFHSLRLLRHTFAVYMAKNPKVNLVELQAWMGHASIKTTMRYAQFQPGAAAAERTEETFADFSSTFPHSPQASPIPVVSERT